MNASPPSLAEQFNEMPIKSPSKSPLLPLYRLCEHCSSPFYSRGGYQAHLRQKHSAFTAQERPFHCDICPQNFTTARYLKSHLTSRHHVNRTDSDLVVYQCDHHHCLFVCTKAAGMLAHRRLAHQEKPEKSNKEVKCDGCGFHFSAVSLYRTHLCRALKPFKCTRCPKTYQRECHLSKHMAKMHPVEEGGDNGYDGDDEKEEEEDTEDTDEEKTDICSSPKSFADVYFAAEQEEDISECLVNAFLHLQTMEKANFEEMDLLADEDNLEDLSTPTYHLLQPANMADIDATLVKVLEAVNEGRLEIEVLQPSLEMEL